jgi:hypothetical protein
MSGKAYQDYMDGQQEGRSHFIGPSGVNSCYRQNAYRYLEVEPSNQRSKAAADLGTLMHLGWSAMISSQFDPAERRPDVPIRIQGMPREGSADDVDFVNKIVTDLKSAKDRVWQGWVNYAGPYESYWEQCELYALGLRQMYGGEWTLRIVGINRETGEVAEWERVQDVEVAQALVDKAAARHTALTASTAMTAAGALPLEVVDQYPREGKGPGMGMPCDWCEFMDLCWPDPSTDDGTPQSETIREDAEAIGRYAQEYLEAAAASRKADTQKREAQQFLKGLAGDFPLPDGGTVSITQVGGKPKQVVDCDAAAERLKELGEEVPMVWSRRASYPRVSKRAAK